MKLLFARPRSNAACSPSQKQRAFHNRGGAIRRKLGLETLEYRRLLAVIDWDGGGDGKTWHDAANWVGNATPGVNDDANIASGFQRVEIRNTVNIKSLQAQTGISVFDASLTLRGSSQIENGLQMVGSSRLDVNGASTVNVFGASNVDNASIFVSGGSQLVLPITTYARSDTSTPSTGFLRYFRSSDANSVIQLPNLTEIVGRTENGRSNYFEAHFGGKILMPSLVKADTGQLWFDAHGLGGLIDVPALTTFKGSFSGNSNGLQAREGASINNPLMTTIDTANIHLINGGTLDTSQITTWSGFGTLYVQGSSTPSPNFNGLSTFDNHSLFVSGGASMTLNISSYARADSNDPSTGFVRYFRSSDANSVIHLPNLTEIVGRTENGRSNYFEAHFGGKILMPSLIKADTGQLWFDAHGVGGLIDVPALTTFKGSFSGNSNGLQAREGASINNPLMTTIDTANLIVNNGGTMDTAQITTWLGFGNLYVQGSATPSPNFNGLSTFDNHSLFVSGGASMTLNISSYARTDSNDPSTGFVRHFRSSDANSVIHLPNLTEIVGRTENGRSNYFEAHFGGKILMPSLIKADTGQLWMDAHGVGGLIDIPALTNFKGFYNGHSNGLQAREGASINNPQMTTIDTVNLYLVNGGTMDTAQITTWSGNGTLYVHGSSTPSPDFNGLSTFDNHNLFVSGGASMTLNITSYARSEANDPFIGFVRYFRSSDANSVINLPNLTEIVGRTESGRSNYFEAQQGGKILMPSLVKADTGQLWFDAHGVGGLIDIPVLTTFNGHFNGNSNGLWVRDGGRIEATSLTSIEDADVYIYQNGLFHTGTIQMGNNSLLQGSGTLDGSVTTSGRIIPGNNLGAMSITGDFTMNSSASLAVDIGGPIEGSQHDKIFIGGSATLAGTLNVQLVGGYNPPVNSTYSVVEAQSISGTFTTVNGQVSALKSFKPEYGSSEFQLRVGIDSALSIPATDATSLSVPSIPGDGVELELFNGIGGGQTPLPSHIEGLTPTGTTLSPRFDFPNPGQIINVGTNFNVFFANTTIPPEAVSNTPAQNFLLNSDFYLAVSPDIDLDPSTPAVDILIGVGSDDGYYLKIGNQVIGSASDRGFTYSWQSLSFESPGLYPIKLLYAANAVGQSGLEVAWETATSNGAQIIPQSALYASSEVADRLVTFEEFPAGTLLTNQYQSEGIQFATISGDLQVMEGRPTDFVPVSASRVFADPATSGGSPGIVEITFTVPGTTTPATTSFFSAFVIDAETSGASLTAYDGDGEILDTQTINASGRSQELVQFNFPRIAKVRITLGDASDRSALDNLRFRSPVPLLGDLVVSDIVVPPNATPGQTAEVTWTISNLGDVTIAGSLQNLIRLSNDSSFGSDVDVGTSTFDIDLEPGESVTHSAMITIPFTGPSSGGDVFWIVRTDSNSQYAEHDEQNNFGISANSTNLPTVLLLSVNPERFREDANNPAAAALLTRSGPANSSLDLLLSSSDTSEATVPNSIQIPAGQNSITFGVSAVLDGVADGSQSLTISASNGSLQATDSIIVDDADFRPQLTVTLNPNSVAESSSNPAILGTVSRDGDLSLPLVVTIASSDSTELVTPTAVLIPANLAEANFFLTVVPDGIVDGNQLVTITASHIHAESGQATAIVVDADTPRIVATLSSPEVTEGDSVTLTVSRNTNTSSELLVQLSASPNNQLNLPSNVTIPAGQPSVTIAIPTVDDLNLEADTTVVITASATGFDSSNASVEVIDEDTPVINIEITPGSFLEGAGAAAAIGTVSRSIVSDLPLTIRLTSSDPTEATVPFEVTIPALQASTPFDIAAVNDTLVDGSQSLSIAAQGLYPDGHPFLPIAAKSITVLDDEPPTLVVSLQPNSIIEGSVSTGTVRRNGNNQSELVVLLQSSDVSEATVSSSVTIPAGADEATFPITAVADGTTDGNQQVILTATAASYASGIANLTVQDSDLPDLVVTSVTAPSPLVSESFFEVTYRVENQGLLPATGVWKTNIYLSKDDQLDSEDESLGEYEFDGSIATGLFYERTVTVRAPLQTGNWYIIAKEDHENEILESSEVNNIRSSSSISVQPEYQATVSTSVQSALAGTNVPLSGRATLGNSSSPAAFKPVNIHIKLRDTVRIISAITDANGDFTALFRPLPGEAGNYSIGAVHPGVTSALDQDAFALIGLSSTPLLPTFTILDQSAPLSQTLSIKNLSQIPLSQLQVQVLDKPDNLQVTTILGDGSYHPTLNGDSSIPIQVSVSSIDDSILSGTIELRITSLEGAQVDIPIQVEVISRIAKLVADPGTMLAGMRRGQQTLVTADIRNDGGIASSPLVIVIPDVPWMKLVSPNPMPAIPVGESAQIVLQLTPPDDLPLGNYTGQIGIQGTNASLSVPFEFRALSDSVGDLLVEVTDEYTYFAEGNPRVAFAHIDIIDAISGTLVQSGVSDAQGLVAFDNLPEGYYRIEITAADHDSYSRTIFIKPGELLNHVAFLPRQLVRYVWQVVPTEIPDVTQVILESTFQTNVPAPVVTIEPSYVDLTVLPFEGGVEQIDIRIRNHGLVAARNARIFLPTHPDYVWQSITVDLGDMPALSELIIPILVYRVDTGHGPCFVNLELVYEYQCGPNMISRWAILTFKTADHCSSVSSPPSFGRIVGSLPGGFVYPNIPVIVEQSSSCDGACAIVKLELDQDVIQTRQAFHADLLLVNGTLSPLTEVFVGLNIFDSDGQDASSLFAVASPELTNISTVDGTGVLAAQTTGGVHWLIIPTLDAAGELPETYSIGGTLQYRENGVLVTIDLAAITITVMPQPELFLKYFWQRDVFSDDPFTPSVQEPSIPFELAVMVDNRGYGLAKQLKIESSQPEIVDNESGLLIDFKIIGTEVDGQSMEPTLTAEFGNVLPGEIRTARWFMTSTLQGHFIDYDASFEHISPFNLPQLSLVQGVEIFEMIASIRDDRAGSDSQGDFLVNQVPDDDDLPDTIHFSDGTTSPVSVIASSTFDGSPTPSDLEVVLTLTPNGSGWNYLRTPDPGLGNFRLRRVVRSDGTELPLDNFWQTDRTFHSDFQRPVYEDNLHLIDFNPSGPYRLIYDIVDSVAPVIGVTPTSTSDTTPELHGTINDPLASIQVMVAGHAWPAINHGNGTWTLPDDLISPLASGRYDVVVNATDPVGNSSVDTTSGELMISLHAPSDLGLSRSSIPENRLSELSDYLVGDLTAVDDDPFDAFSFELTTGEGDNDNDSFRISNNKLYIKSGQTIDFEQQSSYQIRLRVLDSVGNSYVESLTIEVEDRTEVLQVTVGDGSIQRSRIQEITVEFDGIVDILPNAFALTNVSIPNGAVALTSELSNETGKTVARLTFQGSNTNLGALLDGNHILTLDSTKISRIGSGILDGNGDGNPGGDFVYGAREADRFFSLFGDIDGDRTVTVSDFNAFRAAFGRSMSHPQYQAAFDYDDNSQIGTSDFNQFRTRFGKTLRF